MANTVMVNPHGPIWPLGLIVVAAAGTPVSIMSLVDSAGTNDPNAVVSPTSPGAEYSPRAYEIIFQACKAGASHGTQLNTGNIYIIKRGKVAGSGNRDDLGVIIATISQGSSGVYPPVFRITAAPMDRNVFSPYDLYIDADNANDACQVTLLIQ